MGTHTYIDAMCEHCNALFHARTDARKIGQGRYCSRDCASQERARTDPFTRFWSYVNKTETCWLWTGGLFLPKGYGAFIVEHGKKVYAHRWIYEQMVEILPKAIVVRHTCDTPRCVNYERHLIHGTQKDNIQDAVKKGRMASGNRSGRVTHPEATARGSHSGMAKVTEDIVRQIRHIYPSMSQQAIAKQFGIHQGTVSSIIRRKTWTHID